MTKILIIDDAMLSRRKLVNILKDRGLELLEAVDGEEGLTMIKEQQPDLVITDLLMPKIDGLQLLRILYKEQIKIPVVVVSADIQQTTKDICFGLGVVAFLNKPPKSNDVLAAIDMALGAK